MPYVQDKISFSMPHGSMGRKFQLVQVSPKQLPERKPMTIAIGLVYDQGVLLAADTLITYPNGRTKEESKITSFKTNSGIFAIANACDDFDAAKTLVNSVVDTLKRSDVASVGELQDVMCAEMLTWYGKSSANTNPHFILAFKLNQDKPRLYSCEPPNTFLSVANRYIARGTGSEVTDSLYNMLFDNFFAPTSGQVSLREIAYLISRAKKENTFCGKRTDCVVIRDKSTYPSTVNSLDMLKAEQNASQLDFLLQSMAIVYLNSTDEDIERNSKGIAEMIRDQKTMRTTVFRDLMGVEI